MVVILDSTKCSPNISSIHLAPYLVITVLLTVFPVLYFTIPWLFSNYQSVLNPFTYYKVVSKWDPDLAPCEHCGVQRMNEWMNKHMNEGIGGNEKWNGISSGWIYMNMCLWLICGWIYIRINACLNEHMNGLVKRWMNGRIDKGMAEGMNVINGMKKITE